jgi:hypothetical protein
MIESLPVGMENSLFEGEEGKIILLDALGMKGIWKRRQPRGVLETWTILRQEYYRGMQSLCARKSFTSFLRVSFCNSNSLT